MTSQNPSTTVSEEASQQKPNLQDLVYEEMDGQPYYYLHYQAVLNQLKTLEDIMGSSGIQSFIIACIVEFLNDHMDRKTYKVLSNEVGLHINKGNNLAADIAIFEKKELLPEKLTNQYLDIAPKVVIEVDINAFAEELSYCFAKTQKLLDFGTQKILWIFSESRKLLFVSPNKPWLIVDWDYDIEILDDIVLNVQQLLEKEGLK